MPHFLAENESFWGCQGIFLIEFEQRSASQHRPKQSKQSKVKYQTTFFFTIPLPKQIKKVVITTKIPVKTTNCVCCSLACMGRRDAGSVWVAVGFEGVRQPSPPTPAGPPAPPVCQRVTSPSPRLATALPSRIPLALEPHQCHAVVVCRSCL